MSNEYPVNPQPPMPPPAAQMPPTPPPVAPAMRPPTAYVPLPETKSPALAGFLSMFPGLGHLYLGLYQRAFAFGGVFIVGIGLTSHGRGGPFFGPLLGFVWFFAIIDAVRQAHAINRGVVTEGGLAPTPQLKKAGESAAGLTWGIILIGLGSLWLVDRYVDMDWFWDVIDNWGGPAAFILLGLVLVLTHVRKKRSENALGVGMPPRSG